ncbi:MAG TPA: capsule assembly Wzi family protein [Longimicrobiaceae bacterium]|nr:capsule assembly Wzi family protein [Longimicrobiaceae bacterium]
MIPLATIGGDADDRERVAQILGLAPADGYLLRSPSGQAAPLPGGPGPLRWALLAPELTMSWNSALPFSLNDGAIWAGKGLSVWGLGGVRLEYGRVFAVLAPQVGMAQNRSFESFLPGTMAQDRFTPPWFRWDTPADLPLRFGNEAIWSVDPGQSTLGVHLGGADLGVSTESQWWGPGIRNAIVMSNNAPGFPHLFLRTASPWRTRAGAVEAKLLLGVLGESEYFGDGSADGTRSLSGLVATFSPAGEPDLTLGIARTVQSAVDGAGSVLTRAADVFVRWPSSTPDSSDARAAQIVSLFGRWIFPRDGLEVYAEWARHALPEGLGDFLDYPNHAQGYTLGLQWAGRVGGGPGDLRVQTELTSLEQSATFRIRPAQAFYTSKVVPQGYTHRGQVIGAAIGPAASSQWAAADYLAPDWRVGLYLGRVRWHNDAYYARPSSWPFLGHEISLLAGLRGSFPLPYLQFEAELGTEKRLNFLFQNFGVSWETSDSAVDVRNNRLRLGFTPRTRRATRVPAPSLLAPPPVPVTDTVAVPAPETPAAPASGAALPAAAPADSVAVPTPAGDTARVVVPLAPPTAAPPAVPPAAPPARTGADPVAPTPATGPVVHSVREGETLPGIARRYGVGPEEIRAANPAVGDLLTVGQELVIPSPASRTP